MRERLAFGVSVCGRDGRSKETDAAWRRSGARVSACAIFGRCRHHMRASLFRDKGRDRGRKCMHACISANHADLHANKADARAPGRARVGAWCMKRCCSGSILSTPSASLFRTAAERVLSTARRDVVSDFTLHTPPVTLHFIRPPLSLRAASVRYGRETRRWKQGEGSVTAPERYGSVRGCAMRPGEGSGGGMGM
jgi:hypothetical protein